MRQIKFRAWDLEVKRIEKVGALDWDTACSTIITCYTTTQKIYSGYHEQFDFILMQYTGLSDKQGSEIYEGDILRYPSGQVCQVVFSEGGFYAKPKSSEILAFIVSESVEVVGNICENPDLMEVKQ